MRLSISLSNFIVLFVFSLILIMTPKQTMFDKCSNWRERRTNFSQKRYVRASCAGGLFRAVPFARRANIKPDVTLHQKPSLNGIGGVFPSDVHECRLYFWLFSRMPF